MRMYNPEWEALKDVDYTPTMQDVQFDLEGKEIPADHGEVLRREITRCLPWFDTCAQAGIHPVHGHPTGRNDNLLINRRVKLILRLPPDRQSAAAELSGMQIDLGTGPIRVGNLKPLQFTPYATVYSHFVVTEPEDEIEFLAAIRAQLADLGITAGLIPGKRRTMRVSGREVAGYSLLLHDVDLLQSIHVQEHGLGLYRQFGCGIFIPHKSIKEVSAI